jgi:transposase-like protein
MQECKFCHSRDLVKNGRPKGLQRYLCKLCDREQIEGDRRIKYENNIKRSAIILYLEGNGMRAIARILSSIFDTKIYFQTVAKWLTHAGQVVSDEVASMKHESKVIEVVEMDELFTYIKKNKIQSESGLLLIGTHSVYLNLRSVVQKNQRG